VPELFGLLGAHRPGHGSRAAVILGLLGEQPEHVDTEKAPSVVAAVRERGRLPLLGVHEVAFAEREDLILNRKKTLPAHPNGMRMTAYDQQGDVLVERTFYSVGGGFVVDEDGIGAERVVQDDTVQPFPYRSGAELLSHTRRTGLSISDLVLANECVWRSEQEVRDGLLHLWAVMQECVRAGCEAEGQLPGG
jgi:L-serine dehydratase